LIRDDGVGFNVEKAKQIAISKKKFGLLSIIEQISYIGGEVVFDSAINKGTTVTIKLPIKN
jgi:two-component system sensor histidine kinase DegS